MEAVCAKHVSVRACIRLIWFFYGVYANAIRRRVYRGHGAVAFFFSM